MQNSVTIPCGRFRDVKAPREQNVGFGLKSSVSKVSVWLNTSLGRPPDRAFTPCVVLVLGVVGSASNALILYALAAAKQHRKHVLIVNQNALDLFTFLISSVVAFAQIRHCNTEAEWLSNTSRVRTLYCMRQVRALRQPKFEQTFCLRCVRCSKF